MKILLEEKVLGTHSKKNSKYYWVLETITGRHEGSETFQSLTEKVLRQDIFRISKKKF